jgi:hypothetical protein
MNLKLLLIIALYIFIILPKHLLAAPLGILKLPISKKIFSTSSRIFFKNITFESLKLFSKAERVDYLLQEAANKGILRYSEIFRLRSYFLQIPDGDRKLLTTLQKLERLKNLNKTEISFLKTGRFFMYKDHIVVERQVFDPLAKDALGRTNIERMRLGLAPIGKDGKPVELHHLEQDANGIIVEVLSSEHKKYYKELHYHKTVSEIDRNRFNQWKKSYWKERAKEFEE